MWVKRLEKTLGTRLHWDVGRGWLHKEVTPSGKCLEWNVWDYLDQVYQEWCEMIEKEDWHLEQLQQEKCHQDQSRMRSGCWSRQCWSRRPDSTRRRGICR